MILCITVLKTFAQNGDSLLQQATLQNCVQYALQHQPLVQQSLIDEQITEATIKSKLADWYPQLNFDYSLQHNFQLQTTVFAGNTVKIGVDNTSAAQFNATQNIFNRDALLASRTASEVRKYAKQNTGNNKITISVNVSKAFYDVLATMQQIKVADEDINRIEKSLKDAYNQYKVGVTDKTDYKRATITLNNTKATKKSNEEALKARVEYLKSLMGYPVASELNIIYDSLQMENEIALDTLQTYDYSKRIEYQLLTTQKKLQEANVRYNKWSYLPTLSAYGAYNLNFQNNSFGKLYSNSYPNSYAGLTLSWPIFQGFKRTWNTRQAELQVKRVDWDIVNFKNSVNAEYNQALAAYKSNLAFYEALKENVALAQEVYDVIQLQYRSGVKTYLEVIVAESDLRNTQVNYLNALYQVLISKLYVQKAAGTLIY